MPDVRRRPVAARGVGNASRWAQHRGGLCIESARGDRFCPQSAAGRLATRCGALDVGASAIAARFSRRGGIRLFNPRPFTAHIKRRRGTTGFAHQCPRFQPGEYAVRARRALDRPASGRHRSIGAVCPTVARPRQFRVRGGTRRIDDPRRRSNYRNRPRRRRAGRPGGFSRIAAGDRKLPEEFDGRLSRRPTRHQFAGRSSPHRSWLDSRGRRGATI